MSSQWQLGLDRVAFLQEYWQRRPLLIKNPSDNFTPPLSSDELAGLALEDAVESRLIEGRDGRWQLQHGPFSAADFSRQEPWTLLVQAVDHYVPAVAELQNLFDFIPRWRMDDVMVSYAVDGGSVGPHYDNYDVFLLQGEGQRRWRLGQLCDSSSALLPHDELRILDAFDCSEEFLLGPGDMLYVPPGVAHWGIAEGECTTFSIGFRAPRVNDMLSRWTDELLLQIDSEYFFRDAGRAPATRPGEIHTDDIQRAMTQLQQALTQSKTNNWFGELVTEPRYDVELDETEIADAMELLHQGACEVQIPSAAEVAWQHSIACLTVFANGDSFECAESVLPNLLDLCGSRRLTGAALDAALIDPDTVAMFECLLHRGCLHVE